TGALHRALESPDAAVASPMHFCHFVRYDIDFEAPMSYRRTRILSRNGITAWSQPDPKAALPIGRERCHFRLFLLHHENKVGCRGDARPINFLRPRTAWRHGDEAFDPGVNRWRCFSHCHQGKQTKEQRCEQATIGLIHKAHFVQLETHCHRFVVRWKQPCGSLLQLASRLTANGCRRRSFPPEVTTLTLPRIIDARYGVELILYR